MRERSAVRRQVTPARQPGAGLGPGSPHGAPLRRFSNSGATCLTGRGYCTLTTQAFACAVSGSLPPKRGLSSSLVVNRNARAQVTKPARGRRSDSAFRRVSRTAPHESDDAELSHE